MPKTNIIIRVDTKKHKFCSLYCRFWGFINYKDYCQLFNEFLDMSTDKNKDGNDYVVRCEKCMSAEDKYNVNN